MKSRRWYYVLVEEKGGPPVRELRSQFKEVVGDERDKRVGEKKREEEGRGGERQGGALSLFS